MLAVFLSMYIRTYCILSSYTIHFFCRDSRQQLYMQHVNGTSVHDIVGCIIGRLLGLDCTCTRAVQEKCAITKQT